MYSAIQSKFAEAVANGKLIFTDSVEKRVKQNGLSLVYTVAPSLGQKPSAPKPEAQGTPESRSPWLPGDPDLIVETLADYKIVLNKFAVAKYHFLLVTKQFEPQTSLLSPQDLKTSLDVLKRVNKESGDRYIGFFNCGSAAGASVEHKHLQFVKLPDNYYPFPDSTPMPSSDSNIATRTDKRVPFAHYLIDLEPESDEDELAMKYSELLGHSLTLLGRHHLPINYNLVFTEEWMLMTPRKLSELQADPKLGVNSLGTVGLFLAKSEKQLEQLELRGMNLLTELGFEREDPLQRGVENSVDPLGYTHY